MTPLRLAGLVLLWAAATVGISWYVADVVGNDLGSGSRLARVEPIAGADRLVASLQEQTIYPTVSGNGTVLDGETGWMLSAPATVADVTYRLLDPPVRVKALIDGGPTGFDCAWAGLGQGADGGTYQCAIPQEVRVAAGMTGTMVIQLEPDKTVQALPLTAVVGESGTGQVIVIDGEDALSVRSVQIGSHDAFWIEVTGGLEPVETVLVNPTQQDFGVAQ